MIKNIVFDMGKVLVNYEADRVCRHFMNDPMEIKEVTTTIFLSPEWILLDMGVIEEKDAMERMINRLTDNHAKEMAKLCMSHWHEYNMWPIEGMGDVVKALKEKGYKIYLCSNASVRLLTCYQDVIPGIQFFDGILFSAEEKLLKPQKEIYERLFVKFGIKPEESFFVDDLQMNIDGAKACGMDGYCFADGNVERLKEKLFGGLA